MSDAFIGLGHNPNPDVPDIPMGFGMALFQDTEARQHYEALNDEQKSRILHYVGNGNTTGEDAKNKIASVIEELRNHRTDFTF